MNQVYMTLYPETVLNLKKTIYDRKVGLDKLQQVSLPSRRWNWTESRRICRTFANSKPDEWHTARLCGQGKQLKAAKKEIVEIEETIKQYEAELNHLNENLRYYEGKQKRDLDLLNGRPIVLFRLQDSVGRRVLERPPLLLRCSG